MSTAISIYLDESGDLGWQLDKPYKKGGSSRYLTLAAIIVPATKTHLISRVVRGIYKARNRKKSNELKSVDLRSHERTEFVRNLQAIKKNHPDILFTAITVKKSGVNAAFRKHPNGLYNYMTKLMLLEIMGCYSQVDFIPDARSVKVELKHSFHDYLRTGLAENGAETTLTTTPQESKDHFEIQFADILASLVWSHFEFADTQFQNIQQHIMHKKLYFSNNTHIHID
jgi:hypothetical protein